MSHESEVEMIRRLDAAYQAAMQTRDPADWKAYEVLRSEADIYFGIVREETAA